MSIIVLAAATSPALKVLYHFSAYDAVSLKRISAFAAIKNGLVFLCAAIAI